MFLPAARDSLPVSCISHTNMQDSAKDFGIILHHSHFLYPENKKPGPQTGTGPRVPKPRRRYGSRNSVIAGKATRMITRTMSEPTKNITAL